MRVVYLVLLVFLNINITAAQADNRDDKLETLSVHMESLLVQTELALLAASDFLTDRPSVSGAVVEATLQRYVDQVEGLRALLVTDAKGYLKYDTFNKIASQAKNSTKPLYIGDRAYFIGAQDTKGMKVYVPIVGRTSGVPFLPVSRPVYVDESLQHVIIAILSPNKLINRSVHDSEYVVVTIYNLSGDFITAFPDGTVIPENFNASLGVGVETDNRNIVPFNNNEANSIWKINKKYGLVLVFSEIQPSR